MTATEHCDAVVVGSGFGGSVSAYRLAQAGLSVVVMERGQAYPPGSFGRSPARLGKSFWDPSEGLYGLFDVWSFGGSGGFDSVVSAGLGGGSLIYANVLLRKDEKWFVHEDPLPHGGYESWPVTRGDLDPHYDEVERMLGATPYPLDRPAYTDTPKAHAMQDAAAELGLDWRLPPLAISFSPSKGAEPGLGLPIVAPEYGNLHGLERRTCNLCGECDFGCNEGAKNTLDHNYLSAAKHHGADIRTQHEVRGIRPRPGGGYEVDYVVHDVARAGATYNTQKLRVHTIGCERLVLGAGTYGTSYLLLRNRANFPGLSRALGTRYCGNGDLLAFLLRAHDRDRTRPLDASRGPVITSAIRLPDELDGLGGSGRGAYIQDGGYPDFVSWMVSGADVTHELGWVIKMMLKKFREFATHAPDTNMSAELSELISDGALAVSSLPLLGMGRDVPDGVLRLRNGCLDAEWTTKTSEAHFERMRKTMQRIADVLGADFADNPMWFRKRIITVHPLGGAPMGTHPDQGVCDGFGEVYGFPGLYIADGAALPGPVGANPSLTIAALADRMATHLLETRGHSGGNSGGHSGGTNGGNSGVGPASAGPVRGTGDDAACDPELGDAGRTSLSFTEEMKGFYVTGESNPGGAELADHRERFAFRLTITADDVNRFLAETGHTATAEGWIDAAACGGRRQVERGWFNLFVPAGAADRRLMKYRLYFTDGAGQPRTLSGWKNVHHGPPTHIWPDTSTLFFRVLAGHVPEGEDEQARIIGAGILHIELTDFAHQLTTFRTHGPHHLAALTRFGKFFAGELWDVYGPGHDDES
ncbi:MAG TPA: GMC family oxidoreductase [Streptosporangiaceae bacterium]